jgi:hypothetical protein
MGLDLGRTRSGSHRRRRSAAPAAAASPAPLSKRRRAPSSRPSACAAAPTPPQLRRPCRLQICERGEGRVRETKREERETKREERPCAVPALLSDPAAINKDPPAATTAPAPPSSGRDGEAASHQIRPGRTKGARSARWPPCLARRRRRPVSPAPPAPEQPPRAPPREGERGRSEEGQGSQSGEGDGGRVEREALLSAREGEATARSLRRSVARRVRGKGAPRLSARWGRDGVRWKP